MNANPTNDAFLSCVTRISNTLRYKDHGRYHVAVVPTVAGFSARLIDCRDWNPRHLEITLTRVHDDAFQAALLAASSAPYDQEKVVACVLEEHGTGYRWTHLPLVDKSTSKERISEPFVRI